MSRADGMSPRLRLPVVSYKDTRNQGEMTVVPRGIIVMRRLCGDVLQNPVLSPTAKRLQSSLKEMERTTVALGLSRGVRVFILMAGDDGPV